MRLEQRDTHAARSIDDSRGESIPSEGSQTTNGPHFRAMEYETLNGLLSGSSEKCPL